MGNPELNAYGDAKTETTGRHGSDISSQRIDDLDRACLDHILQSGTSLGRALDLGSGLGYHAVRMAALGRPVVSLDMVDLSSTFESLRRGFPALDIVHLTGRVEDLLNSPELGQLSLVYSQRTLHYLRYPVVVDVMRNLASRLEADAFCYLSMSGIDSELGRDYPAASDPIASRWARLSRPLAEKHGIAEPVCLYAETDIHTLSGEVGFDIVKLWSSDFGNVKAILQKK